MVSRKSAVVGASIAFALLLVLPVALASSNSGIEIKLRNFNLNVYYSDALDYPGQLEKTIRDPRKLLFTLVSVLQPNEKNFASIEHTVQVDLYIDDGTGESRLQITEDPATHSIILRDGLVLGKDIEGDILKTICGRYTGACSELASRQIMLYPCNKTDCPGRLRFGAFPSEDVNEKFRMDRPRHSSEKGMSVTRAAMSQYFEEISP